MGLDIYVGSVTRYVAGDWQTIIQQTGAADGIPVVVHRPNEPDDVERDVAIVEQAVREWQQSLLRDLGCGDQAWPESATSPYSTDKPDWDGYGAVVLLAAHIERPDLAPGSRTGKTFRRRTIEPVLPRAFPDSDAFKAASTQPSRYPTLLRGAEWCLPIPATGGVVEATTPNGSRLMMGSVQGLLAELHDLNNRTLRLTPEGIAQAIASGPPGPDAPHMEVAPFGLAVLTSLAEHASANRQCWIMDY